MNHISLSNNLLSRLAERDHPQPSSSHGPTLPSPQSVGDAQASLPDSKSPQYLAGLSAQDTASHIINDIVPALTGQAQSGRYYGFVTGGVLPLAEWADNVVSWTDQNVQVHLPTQSVATAVEASALEMMTRLLRLGDDDDGDDTWTGRTFTTGATGANILGLACGRQVVVDRRLGGNGNGNGNGNGSGSDHVGQAGVGEVGVLEACAQAGIRGIQVLTSAGHSSLAKAASVVGLGRRGVKDMVRSSHRPWLLDLDAVERELQTSGVVSIIAISAGDVNTGGYALENRDEWVRLRALADEYGAWIHVDGAFGVLARALPDEPQFDLLRQRTAGIALADSLALDGHKLLNVPYDCGIFLTRSPSVLTSVFTNPNAAYLTSASGATIPSPLNIGLENSRRFRALPVYAVLLSEGRPGIAAMLSKMVTLARRLASFLRESPHYQLLPDESAPIDNIFMIVLFRAQSTALNEQLVDRINQTREMYVSGTTWNGEKAARIAVASWKVDVERDYVVVTSILDAVAQGQEFDMTKL